MSSTESAIREKIYCAIDTPDMTRAGSLAAALSGAIGGIKLGLEFFSANGPGGVRRVMDKAADADLFLDLKFHDIPNTVAAAMRAVAPLGPRLINVHASGGKAMMEAAREAAMEGAEAAGVKPPRVLGVTVLTSLDGGDLQGLGVPCEPVDQVLRLATLAAEAGLDGVVCSAREIAALRKAVGRDFLLVTPGIRPAGAEAADQKRVVTPAEAIADGADYLVMGRPITGEPDPAEAVIRIARQAAEAVA
ncbi:MAG TPA: orotidine-5'-phosphate decarboxylase [Alphaproteobacteria bacterium]|nr:orotidine-5'-phosphate decarboxylase [Alphaproteobacteria bacterium]